MSIQQIVNNLVQLDTQVQKWADGRATLPNFDEVARLRLQMVALLYVPVAINTGEGQLETSLGSCLRHRAQIPEPIYEKLELLRSQIHNFDQQLAKLQNRMVQQSSQSVVIH